MYNCVLISDTGIYNAIKCNQLYTKIKCMNSYIYGVCLGYDHMVVGFTTTYVMSAYHHQRCELESRS